MKYLLALLVTGCSFGSEVMPSAGDLDAPPADAPADAALGAEMMPPKDMMLPLCAVGVAATPGSDRGRVGGDGGGNNFGPLVCMQPSDRIVGVGVRLSNQDTIYGDRSAHGVTIACATVTIDPNTGIGTTGTPYTREVMGNGNAGWSPSTLFPPAMCPAGEVVNGLRARIGEDENLFNNLDIRCAKLAGDATTTSSANVHVDNSGTNNQNAETVNCGTNEILVQMANRTGTGFDSANLFCAPATCL